MARPRVFFYVQHLLGIGHVRRTAILARALAREGIEVTVASGGMPVPQVSFEGVRFVQLPPVTSADLTFKVLVDESGRLIDDAWKRRRAAALQSAWRAADPRVVVFELFPFGRRKLQFELLPMLEALAALPRRPLLVSSVRDILSGQKKPERQEESLALAERWIDHILLHGDRSVIPFERTFVPAPRVTRPIHYTGYVLDAPPAPQGDAGGKGEVIVSAGGSAIGDRLLETAIRARPRTALRDRTWRVLAGVGIDEATFGRLRRVGAETGEGRVVVERARPDFIALLANCELSVSQAGYNTLLETVQVGARAVVVPFAGGTETEQAQRAECFAERGLVGVLEEHALSADALAAAIDRAAGKPRPRPGRIDLDGARESARLLAGWARARPAA